MNRGTEMKEMRKFTMCGVALAMLLAAGTMYATTVYVGGSGTGHYSSRP